MFTVYILQNTISKRFYIGSTNDIRRRIDEHNRGQSISTNRKGTWLLKYYEEYNSNIKAKRRERKIKAYKGGNGFKKLIAGVVQR